MSIDHLCAIIDASGSGFRQSLGDVADGWLRGEIEQSSTEAMAGDDLAYTGYGSGGVHLFEKPSFEQICHNVTVNMTQEEPPYWYLNITEHCEDAPGPYDTSGFYRRAPSSQRYGWARDVMTNEIMNDNTHSVVAPLDLGGEYIFRVAALYHSNASHHYAVKHDAYSESAIFSMPPYERMLMMNQILQGDYSAFSKRIVMQVSGPGAPISLEVDAVGPNAFTITWGAPPFNSTSGLWHGNGGAPLIGYRVLMWTGDQPAENATLVASVTDTGIRLTDLPPQTLYRLQVVAENVYLRGRYSETLSVATEALRATLWSDCGHSSKVFQPMSYQGCFREVDTSLETMDMPPALNLPEYSSRLTADLCASVCEPHLFFGLRAGGICLCGNDEFGRYGAVEDHECNMPCTGEPKRLCGGINRTSIYRRSGRHGVMLGVGSYHSYDLIRMRLAASSLSSITMPKGLVLTLFTRDELKGMSLNLTSSESCLSQQACPLDLQTTKWAEPAPRCKGDVWDNQAVSLTLTYANGLLPNYTPRPSAETGARAFALGSAGMLSRLNDLGGDLENEVTADRPAGALTQYYRAPRNGDREECAVRVGSYSADPICLQPYKMEVPEAQTNWVRKNPFKLYETLAEKERLHEFSDEFARLKRREWRQTLKEYAEPFYLSRIMSGEIGPEVELDPWFVRWLESIEHLVHLLSRQPDGSAPLLGLDERGGVVSKELSAAPPLPEHPFPAAEERGDGLVAKANRDASVLDGTSHSNIQQRLEAQREIAARGPDMAQATFDTVADRIAGIRSEVEDPGPTHDPMVPYATPKLEARAAAGTNVAYEAAKMEATTEAPPEDEASAAERRRRAEEEQLPFFTHFV